MKKFLLTVFSAFFCLLGMAQTERTYNEQYVYAPEEAANQGNFSNPQSCVINVTDNGNGLATFVFKDFSVDFGGGDVPLGDITLSDVPLIPIQDGLTNFAAGGTFEDGLLSGSTYNIGGKMNDVKFFAGIEIVMVTGQTVYVVIGTDDFQSESNATVYTEPLIVVVNNEPQASQETDVTVIHNGDGTINFELKNFVLAADGMEMGVGNIILENVAVETREDGLEYFTYDGTLFITAGDKPGVVMWVGPMFTDGIPLVLNGKMNDTKLFVTIDIQMAALGQVYVQLGTDDFPAANARTYTEPLIVVVNGEPQASQETDVTVIDNGDGTINFELKNFVLAADGMEMGVGNIILEKVAVETREDGLEYFRYDGTLFITEGDKPGVAMWVGPMFTDGIPLVLNGKMNDTKLFVTIDIQMAALGQVYVQLGTDDFNQKPSMTYTEPYIATVNGEKQEQETTDIIVYYNGDYTIDFVLPKFVIHAGITDLNIGDICLENIPFEVGDDNQAHFASQEGSTFSVPEENIPVYLASKASLFKDIPYTLTGTFNEKHLTATIDIDMSRLNYSILVEVGLRPGDINGDNITDIADVVAVLSVMAGTGQADWYADMNHDGAVDIADVVKILTIMAGNND